MIPQKIYRSNFLSQCIYCFLFNIFICVILKDCSAGEVEIITSSKEHENSMSSVNTPLTSTIRTIISGDEEPKPSVLDSKEKEKVESRKADGRGRAMSSVFGLDPMGMLKSASRVLTKGVHTFRESLHEGVKVAQMLKDDVDEGIIWGKKNSKNKEEAVSNHEETEETMNKQTEESASEAQNFSQDRGKYSNQQQSFREGMLGGIGGILRFMNVDSSRLGIIALNLLIYVAEMITSSLLGKDNSIPQTRAIKANILEYFVTGHSKMLDNLMKDAKSEKLPENLIETLKVKTGNDTSCVQLLICKMSPLIWSVQKTLADEQSHNKKSSYSQKANNAQERPRSGGSGSGSESENSIFDHLYSALPSKDGFLNYGDKCEARFPNCPLLKFTN